MGRDAFDQWMHDQFGDEDDDRAKGAGAIVREIFQIPPDLVVKSQAIDIAEVI